ncbi:MAG: hypothetical protein NC213_06115 [Acetobacter sp.]|nr:hypothetical protein [Bacteroides sp.]MCM1341301.1 hypothetical protein [Acetobacter sp.]MCM1433923.1 hypothetical protein [Clostridiales bacterium]
MSNEKDKQTINSLNNYDVDASVRKHSKSYKDKYRLDPTLVNKYSSWTTNPTVQPDDKTEMGVPIPSQLNTEFSKEYEEENQL